MILTNGGESEVIWLLSLGVLERDWNFFNFGRCGMLIYQLGNVRGKPACLFARYSDLLTSIHDNRGSLKKSSIYKQRFNIIHTHIYGTSLRIIMSCLQL